MQSVLPICCRRALADTSPVARSVEPRSIMRSAAEAGFLDLRSRPSRVSYSRPAPAFSLTYRSSSWAVCCSTVACTCFIDGCSIRGGISLSSNTYRSCIALIIVEWGFIAGVLIGIVVGLATFALSVSRVHAIKFSFDGSEYHSSLDRRPDELALLAEYGREIQGMFLHSYLFFGSANRLHQHVKALLAKQKCRFLLFDFRLVTGIDSSATFSFTQIKQVADQCGTQMIFTCLTRDVENAFRATRFFSDIVVAPNLDAALETCENAIIEAHQTRDSEAGTLREWFTEALGGAENADQLIQHCRRIEVQPDEIIAREGDPANSMHFILDGRVGIMVNGCSAPVRVRSLGPHTTIGEMGLITRQPRSATMQAEVVSVLYELSASAYERIKCENPGLSHALLTYMITVMAERLSFANRAIGVLQR